MTDLNINLLGSFEVIQGDSPVATFESDKVRALLAYLAVESDRPHRREKLVGLLWPEWPERSARQSLSQALFNLRAAIGDREAEPPFLDATRQTVQFNRESNHWLDTAALTQLVNECKKHDHARQEACDTCLRRLEQAASIYRGGFMEGFSLPDSAPFEEWLRSTREELHRLALETFQALAASYEVHGNLQAALQQARHAADLDPCWENGQRTLMRLLAVSGQSSAALAQYDRLRQALDSELGVLPSEETDQLYQLIVKGERPPATPLAMTVAERRPRPVDDCPYRGLAAFRQKDAPFFFGRDSFTDRLAQAVIARAAVAAIVGSSGSGKSSAVFAGLVPRLQQVDPRRWLIASFRPGDQPYLSTASALLPLLEPDLGEVDRLAESSRLASALYQGDISLMQVVERVLEKQTVAQCILLIVDQFEELYTLCRDPEVQRRFLSTLLGAVAVAQERPSPPACLVLTLRADFMGQALTDRKFADVLQESTWIVGPMTRDELRTTIVNPAEVQGAAFEEGLVDRILDDVGTDPGNLPLLEFALTLLWGVHEYGWLTHAGYDRIGRVSGALTLYADQVFNHLNAEESERARQVFVQLIRPGEGTDDTRRVATRAEFTAENWALGQLLADRRLVVTGQDAGTGLETVEVVHEALIQKWDLLRAWIDTDRAFRIWQERLRVALRGWEASERDEGALLRGAPLAQAESWLQERESEFSRSEADYILASAALRERRKVEQDRRRRQTILALVGGIVVALSLAVVAFVARRQAAADREDARRQAGIGLAAQALVELEGDYPERAVLLALEALEHYPYAYQAESALAHIVQEYRPHSFPGNRATWSPDGKRLALFPSSPYLTIDLVIQDTVTGAQLQSFSVPTGDVYCVLDDMVWSPAADRLAVTTYEMESGGCPSVTIWDAKTGALQLTLPPELGDSTNVVWSQDGSALLTGGDDGRLRVWDARSGDERLAILSHGGRIQGISLTAAGDLLATASADGTAKVWEVRTLLAEGETGQQDPGSGDSGQLCTLQGHVGGVQDVAWSPDGNHLASAGEDGAVRIWSLSKDPNSSRRHLVGDVTKTLSGHDSAVISVAWSPDGKHIATLGEDDTARMWDAETGMELFRGPCLSIYAPVPEVSWSPAGELVCTAIESSWAWDVSQLTVQLVGHTDNVWGARYSPDGTRIATTSHDGSAKIWNSVTGDELLEMHGTGRLTFVAWSPDGTRVVTVGLDGPAQVWDANDGKLLFEITRSPQYSNFSVGWSEEGSKIAISCIPGAATQVVDGTTGEVLAMTEARDCALHAPDWSPDGTRFATGCWIPDEGSYPDGKTPVRIWDGATGRELLAIQSDRGWSLKGVWSPDGERLAVAHGTNGMADWAITIWRILTHADGTLSAEEQLTYTGHGDQIWEVRWSPDGRRIASSDMSAWVHVWDATTGDTAYTFQTPGYALNLDWSPDGKNLLAAGFFPTPLIFRVWSSTEALIEYAYGCCVARQLTPQEREQLGLPPAE